MHENTGNMYKVNILAYEVMKNDFILLFVFWTVTKNSKLIACQPFPPFSDMTAVALSPDQSK